MDRRTFLKGLISGTLAVAAAATASSATASIGNTDKYVRLVNQQKMIISLNDRKRANTNKKLTPLYEDNISKQVQRLFNLLNTEFDGTQEMIDKRDEMYAKVRQIFYRELEIDTLSEDELKRYENTLITIAVARYLLAYRQVSFNPNKVPDWDLFTDRYLDVILAA